MPKFRVRICVEDYWDYVVEAESVVEAHLNAERAWSRDYRDAVVPTIEIDPTIDDDTEVGDVG